MSEPVDFSHAITTALNAGALEDAEILIEAECDGLFKEEEEEECKS